MDVAWRRWLSGARLAWRVIELLAQTSIARPGEHSGEDIG
jgi:hypothetical protein